MKKDDLEIFIEEKKAESPKFPLKIHLLPEFKPAKNLPTDWMRPFNMVIDCSLAVDLQW